MSWFYWILITMFAGDVAWLYFAQRRLPRRWMRVAAAIFGGAMLFGLVAMLFLRRIPYAVEDDIPRWWHSIILVWHLLVLLPWLIVQLGRGVGFCGQWCARKFARHAAANSSLAEPLAVATTDEPSTEDRALFADAPASPAAAFPSPADAPLSRRQFIGAAAVFTPPLLTLGAAAIGEMQLDDFRVRRIEVRLADLPPALDGATIAHVTDIHVGRFTRGAVLGRIVEATNALNADIVALTGDLINDSLRAMPAAVELVNALRARSLVVTCEGNHDLIENPREFYRLAEQGGLPLLRSETAITEVRGHRVQILGLPWLRTRSLDKAEAAAQMQESANAVLAKRDPNAWHVALAHHPHLWDHLPGIPLTLAGHTHGGQLMLNEEQGAGPMMFRYWTGEYREPKERPKSDNEALIVSNGTGNWFPVRIQAPAEIIHITLRGRAV